MSTMIIAIIALFSLAPELNVCNSCHLLIRSTILKYTINNALATAVSTVLYVDS